LHVTVRCSSRSSVRLSRRSTLAARRSLGAGSRYRSIIAGAPPALRFPAVRPSVRVRPSSHRLLFSNSALWCADNHNILELDNFFLATSQLCFPVTYSLFYFDGLCVIFMIYSRLPRGKPGEKCFKATTVGPYRPTGLRVAKFRQSFF